MDVFLDDENAHKAAWTVHVGKLGVTWLAISRPPYFGGAMMRTYGEEKQD